MQRLMILLAIVAVAACQSPAPSPSPSPTAATGVNGLVAELVAAGAKARLGGSFSTELLGGEGHLVCVGTVSVQVYEFRDAQALQAAIARIDPKDPSHIGNAIVEWIGTPHFWARDRLLVQYVGEDPATSAVLFAVLGRPFAQGPSFGGAPPRASDCA